VADRDFDIVLFGATGFTGGLTAQYLARHAPASTRWALAGRNEAKLARVRDDLAAVNPALSELPLLVADVTDAAALADIAARTRVLITTVGPYLAHGEPLVQACADAGTDYVDLTGEAEFVDLMYSRHHDRAVQTGARIVHSCGFDSIPHDLGALYAVQQLGTDAPISLRGVVRASGQPSGGTFHTVIASIPRTAQAREAARRRREKEGKPAGRRSRAVAGKPHRDAELGYWLVPLPTIDPAVVAHSGAALASYGPDFSYSHYAGIKTLRYLVGGVAGIGALGLAAQVGPLRRMMLEKMPQGDGPDEQRRARSWFTVDFIGESAGRRVHTRVSGGDPGYGETAKMLAESALCLAFDDNPPTAGQVTTAAAMGTNLTARLVAAGICFETVT